MAPPEQREYSLQEYFWGERRSGVLLLTLEELYDTSKLEAPPFNMSVREFCARVEFGSKEE